MQFATSVTFAHQSQVLKHHALQVRWKSNREAKHVFSCSVNFGVIHSLIERSGFFCAGTGLSAVSGGCSPGFGCPNGSSSSTQLTCVGGYFCVANSTSSSNTACAIGNYCPTGSSVMTRCTAGTRFFSKFLLKQYLIRTVLVSGTKT
jgi:hypothetical protein